MTRLPRFAIPSFPGSNGEVDNLRTLRRCGFDAFVFRWNDSLEKLADVDGYFLGAGFSYEDRGRSGMVAARDPLLRHLHIEAARGKVIIGNCNGAQILLESGLVPLGDGRLAMALAHNTTADGAYWSRAGFLNQWVWITPSCPSARCATSAWSGALHVPIAHGEGRFVTSDPDLMRELSKRGQIAFRYCDASGTVSSEPPITPNGSTLGIAGICNPEGNVVALMPHPERTPLGDPYFRSIHSWLQAHSFRRTSSAPLPSDRRSVPPSRVPMPVEIFIDTIITNNEERTVEQAARRRVPSLRLRQLRYVGLSKPGAETKLLSTLSFFNPHKETAIVRRDGSLWSWDADARALRPTQTTVLRGDIVLLRRDVPDPGASIDSGAQSGICSVCSGVDLDLITASLLEIFGNPHASILERMVES